MNRFLLTVIGSIILVFGCSKAKPPAVSSRNSSVGSDSHSDLKAKVQPSVLEPPRTAIQLAEAAENALFTQRQLSTAEAHLRALLKIEPSNLYANGTLAYLLSISGRRWEAEPYLLHLIRVGRSSKDHLAWLGVPEALVANPQELQACLQAAPQDPLPMLGLARIAIQNNDHSVAKDLLHKAIELDPNLSEAQARLGYLLLDENDSYEAWNHWHSALPSIAEQHPEIWAVRGLRSVLAGDRYGAIRCFGETLRLDGDNQLATYELSLLLKSVNQLEAAEHFAVRANRILQLADVLHVLQQTAPNDTNAMNKASILCEELGRIWEAVGWCLVANQLTPHADWPKLRTKKLLPELTADLPQTKASADPKRFLKLESYPLPQWDESTRSGDRALATNSTLRFENDAQNLGIEFSYYNGRDSTKPGTRMFEVNGGGVAVLDYDKDGWPDIYFTQGSAWPPSNQQNQFLDPLYRNLSGQSFALVTTQATLHEPGFSQGVAVGDFDCDGFPDLYVANIGGNRLFRNHGDGTFQDATETAGLSTACWTTSCLVADLNSDGLPDIYDVNYLKGDDVYERVCRYSDGQHRVCVPGMFEGEQDHVLVNLGDGRFEDQSIEMGISEHRGKGLGILAGDFRKVGALDLFIANDQMHNFFYQNSADGDRLPRLQEQGLLSGLAVDWRGRSQACMGVAADDTDSDGKMDLFVTNFYNESNCLYRAKADGMFADETSQAGLKEASFSMLGFGTQFIDGELDGHPDLVIANGHIEDRTDLGVPYAMPPQYYRNQGNGNFAEVTRDLLGPYFQNDCVGRSLARIDWNRDGLEDFVVSNLHSNGALVTNRTKPIGNFLGVELVGVHSCRDAVGTCVQISANQFTREKQLVAGDGFQASNQRQINFGTGIHRSLQNLTVRWPSGLVQSWDEVATNRVLLIIEGNQLLIERVQP